MSSAITKLRRAQAERIRSLRATTEAERNEARQNSRTLASEAEQELVEAEESFLNYISEAPTASENIERNVETQAARAAIPSLIGEAQYLKRDGIIFPSLVQNNQQLQDILQANAAFYNQLTASQGLPQYFPAFGQGSPGCGGIYTCNDP